MGQYFVFCFYCFKQEQFLFELAFNLLFPDAKSILHSSTCRTAALFDVLTPNIKKKSLYIVPKGRHFWEKQEKNLFSLLQSIAVPVWSTGMLKPLIPVHLMMLRHSNPQCCGVETYGAAAPNLERCGALLSVISPKKLSNTRVLGYTAPRSTQVHNIAACTKKKKVQSIQIQVGGEPLHTT